MERNCLYPGQHRQVSFSVVITVDVCECTRARTLHGLTGSTFGHRSITPGFKPPSGYVRRAFRLSLCLITFEGR